MAMIEHYKVRVYHAAYGCETGCCGHIVEISRSGEQKDQFTFEHPYGEDFKTWAKREAESVISEKWPECLDSIYWDSIECEEVSDS